MTYFSISNWDEFQHYKDRNPPWIKLHNQLLDNYEFENLPDATKGHLLCIWMLASRTNNKLPYDPAWIKRKIGANSAVDLKTLQSSGFIELHNVEQDASKVLVPEEKRRDREEGESEKSETDFSVFINFSKFQLSELKRIRSKNKGGAITQRVADGIADEFIQAQSAGLTIDRCLTEWEIRSWKSFKFSWMKVEQKNKMYSDKTLQSIENLRDI